MTSGVSGNYISRLIPWHICLCIAIEGMLCTVALPAATQYAHFESQSVPGVSFEYPAAWTRPSESFGPSGDSKAGALDITLRPPWLRPEGPRPVSPSDDMSSEELQWINEHILRERRTPQADITLSIVGFGRSMRLSDQNTSARGPQLYDSRDRRLPDRTVRVHGGQIHIVTIERMGGVSIFAAHIGKPYIELACEADTNLSSVALKEMQDEIARILETLKLPDNVLLDPEPERRYMGPFLQFVGAWLIIVLLCALMLWVICKVTPSAWMIPVTSVAGTLVFYAIYVHLVALICLALIVAAAICSLPSFLIAALFGLSIGSAVKASAGIVSAAVLGDVVLLWNLAKSYWVAGTPSFALMRSTNNMHPDLLTFINQLMASKERPPFNRILITREPMVSVKGSILGRSQLTIGFPILFLLNEDALTSILCHEASHNDRHALSFNLIVGSVIRRLHHQRRFLKGKASEITSDMPHAPIVRGDGSVDQTPVMRAVAATGAMLTSVVVAVIADSVSTHIVEPLNHRFEFYCDSVAYRLCGERVFARALLVTAVIQSCWESGAAIERLRYTVPDVIAFYQERWARSKSTVASGLVQSLRYAAHPPLALRLAAMNCSAEDQEKLIRELVLEPASNGTDNLSRIREALAVALPIPDVSSRRKKSRNDLASVLVQQSGLLPL
jgi:Zn-dependent protease with chaperone function